MDSPCCQFPKHNPDKFVTYTELSGGGFILPPEKELYLIDESGGFADLDGCYYDTNGDPSGWIVLKNEGQDFEQYDQDQKFVQQKSNLYYSSATYKATGNMSLKQYQKLQEQASTISAAQTKTTTLKEFLQKKELEKSVPQQRGNQFSSQGSQFQQRFTNNNHGKHRGFNQNKEQFIQQKMSRNNPKHFSPDNHHRFGSSQFGHEMGHPKARSKSSAPTAYESNRQNNRRQIDWENQTDQNHHRPRNEQRQRPENFRQPQGDSESMKIQAEQNKQNRNVEVRVTLRKTDQENADHYEKQVRQSKLKNSDKHIILQIDETKQQSGWNEDQLKMLLTNELQIEENHIVKVTKKQVWLSQHVDKCAFLSKLQKLPLEKQLILF